MENHPVVIIGGGMAGLTCASYLVGYGIIPTIIEAAESPGDGFILTGWKVFCWTGVFGCSSQPTRETRKLLNYEALQLRNFRSGGHDPDER